MAFITDNAINALLNYVANNAADPFERRWPNWADKYNQ